MYARLYAEAIMGGVGVALGVGERIREWTWPLFGMNFESSDFTVSHRRMERRAGRFGRFRGERTAATLPGSGPSPRF